MFNGRVYDPETGFYYYRTRYLDPRAGRFTTRDTIGIWGDPANLGNGYAFVGNNPINRLDPMGMGLLLGSNQSTWFETKAWAGAWFGIASDAAVSTASDVGGGIYAVATDASARQDFSNAYVETVIDPAANRMLGKYETFGGTGVPSNRDLLW